MVEQAAKGAGGFPDWVASPTITVDVEHGSGKSVVTGRLTIVFNGPNTVYVRTDAHHNDDATAITFRDREWLVDGHLTRKADGAWMFSEVRGPWGLSVRERGSVGSTGAPRTFTEAIGAAILATVAAHWTAERGMAGGYARAVQQLKGAREDLAETREAFGKAAALVESLEREAAAFAPPAASVGAGEE